MSINYSALPYILNDEVKLVRVHTNGSRYTFMTTLDLQPGDHVVVDARDTLAAAVVVDFDGEVKEKTTYKWVVAKLDLTEWEANKANTQLLIKKTREVERNIQRSNLRTALAESGLDLKQLATQGE